LSFVLPKSVQTGLIVLSEEFHAEKTGSSIGCLSSIFASIKSIVLANLLNSFVTGGSLGQYP